VGPENGVREASPSSFVASVPSAAFLSVVCWVNGPNPGKSYIEDLEKARYPANEGVAARLDRALDAGGQLVASLCPGTAGDAAAAEGLDALEFVCCVTASDVSALSGHLNSSRTASMSAALNGRT
jgi:hypothetical protein